MNLSEKFKDKVLRVRVINGELRMCLPDGAPIVGDVSVKFVESKAGEFNRACFECLVNIDETVKLESNEH